MPAASGAAAEVPVCLSVHDMRKSTVTCRHRLSGIQSDMFGLQLGMNHPTNSSRVKRCACSRRWRALHTRCDDGVGFVYILLARATTLDCPIGSESIRSGPSMRALRTTSRIRVRVDRWAKRRASREASAEAGAGHTAHIRCSWCSLSPSCRWRRGGQSTALRTTATGSHSQRPQSRSCRCCVWCDNAIHSVSQKR